MNYFQHIRKHPIFSNFSYLSLIQLLNLTFPLITYPYLIRVLGKEHYGMVAFANSLVSYMSIVVNYGFNITATKNISLFRNEKHIVATIVSSVFIIKILLFICSYILFAVVIILTGLHVHSFFFLISGLLALNEVFLPVWYYQGIEKLSAISIISFLNKLLFIALMLVFIKTESDFVLVPILQLMGILLTILYVFYLIIVKQKIQLQIPSFTVIWGYVKESFPFFTSRISGVLTLESNNIFIGAILGYKEVAYYDLAKKIITILLVPYNVLNDAVYPNVTRSKDMVFMKKLLMLVAVSSVLLYVLLNIFSKQIILFIAGPDLLDANLIIQILCISIPISAIGFFLGNTVLVVMNKNFEFNFSVVLQLIVFTVLSLILISLGQW